MDILRHRNRDPERVLRTWCILSANVPMIDRGVEPLEIKHKMSALSASMSLAAPVQLRSRRSGLVAKTVVPMQRRRVMATRMSAVSDEEIAELEKKLAAAKATRGPVSTAEPSNGEYSGASFNIQTFNAISPVGLQKFEKGKYKVAEKVADLDNQPMAIMLRSHKLQVRRTFLRNVLSSNT
eukprot:1024010-Prorocentrum_minimum.AAC.2